MLYRIADESVLAICECAGLRVARRGSCAKLEQLIQARLPTGGAYEAGPVPQKAEA